MSQRPVYLISYNNSRFPAHWSLWIPFFDDNTPGDYGKVIHVEGDARNGFTHRFKRNYNVKLTGRPHSLHLIDWTDVANIVDGAHSGRTFEDVTATDIIEQWALHVAAPGPSLRSANSSSSGPRTRVQIQNCQTWMRELVVKLVEERIFPDDALEKLDAVPKN
ncbi:hypothetical protein PVAG01_04404 [Phlyctema vagabunda]|uniref:Uncharacterized protein n=1 Tax=Phlyctema vagabunda TaxID=108571 RepID=A0ABR4PPI9_9HELO